MTTRNFNRPTSTYVGESGLTNTTKYQDDSTATPRRAISSAKVDGDINYLIDAVNILYDTAVNSTLPDGSVTNAKIRNAVGLSVIGRSANTTGSVADIVAGTDGHVLRRSGTTLGFGTLSTASIADSAITTIKLNSTVAIVPTGAVMPYAGSSAPANWLFCDGSAVSRTTYAALFATISTTYGAGDGSTTFNLPDLRGRTPFGLDNMGGTAANRVTAGVSGVAGSSLGASGGNEAMQQHTHGVTDPGHAHSIQLIAQGTTAGNFIPQTTNTPLGGVATTNSATTGISIQNAGSGSSQNMPPALILNYIICT